MSLHTLTRIGAAVAVVAVSHDGLSVEAEFTVGENVYTGTAKATAGEKGAFTAKFTFTSPAAVDADVTGKTAGDSVTFDAKYVDSGRNCSGTFTGKGTAEKDGSKASGGIAIKDSCEGEITGTFRLWR